MSPDTAKENIVKLNSGDEVMSDEVKVASAETVDKVQNLVAEHLGCRKDDVVGTADFVDDLGADSLDQAELCMLLEEEFGFEVPDEDAEKMVTVADTLEYLANRGL